MSVYTSFVGQLVHKNVATAMKDMLKNAGTAVDIPWPEGTTFESNKRSTSYDHYLWSHTAKGPWGSRSVVMQREESPFREEAQDIRWCIRIDPETHNVTASGEYSGMVRGVDLKIDLGPLPYPIVPFCLSWDVADMIVQSNESWAIGWWFASDLIEWLEERKIQVIMQDDL